MLDDTLADHRMAPTKGLGSNTSMLSPKPFSLSPQHPKALKPYLRQGSGAWQRKPIILVEVLVREFNISYHSKETM